MIIIIVPIQISNISDHHLYNIVLDVQQRKDDTDREKQLTICKIMQKSNEIILKFEFIRLF